MSLSVAQLITHWQDWLIQSPSVWSENQSRPATEGAFHEHLHAQGIDPDERTWNRFMDLLWWREHGDPRPLQATLLRQSPGISRFVASFGRCPPHHRPFTPHERTRRIGAAHARRRMAGLSMVVGLILVGLFASHRALLVAPWGMGVGALVALGGLLAWLALDHAARRYQWISLAEFGAWKRHFDMAWLTEGPAWNCSFMEGDRAVAEAYVKGLVPADELPSPIISV